MSQDRGPGACSKRWFAFSGFLFWSLFVAVFGLASSLAAADYQESFREGVKAYDQQRWLEVEVSMREALGDRPHADKTSVAIFSSRRIAYVPNTFLAIALGRLGRCDEALPWFDRARDQGIAKERAASYYEEMVTVERQCLDRLIGEAQSRAEKAFAAAQDIRERIRAAPGRARLLFEREPGLRNRLRDADEAVRATQQRLSAGLAARDLTTVRGAAAAAEKVMAELIAANSEAARLAQVEPASLDPTNQQSDAPATRPTPRDQNPEPANRPGRQLVTAAAQRTTTAIADAERSQRALRQYQNHPELAGWASTAELGVAERRWAADLALAKQLAERSRAQRAPRLMVQAHDLATAADRGFVAVARDAERRLAAQPSPPNPIPSTLQQPAGPGGATEARTTHEIPSAAKQGLDAPGDLRLAIASYLSGHYEEALRLIPQPTGLQDAHLRARTYLLRAAARLAAGALAAPIEDATQNSARDVNPNVMPSPDFDPLTAVRADLAAARQSDPALTTNVRYFSPTLRTLFDEIEP